MDHRPRPTPTRRSHRQTVRHKHRPHRCCTPSDNRETTMAKQDQQTSSKTLMRVDELPLITSGTGKSHFVEALAHAAIEADLRVLWFTLETLTQTVNKAKADGSVARTVAKVCSCDLVVVDDIGMLPAGQDAAEAFYRIVDAAYERRSVAVTSNIHPSGFDTIMPKTLATATVDRLLHHAHVIVTKGDSHRLADALAGKGVHPLD
nr:ATP-binding protein [Rhodococcus jostii]